MEVTLNQNGVTLDGKRLETRGTDMEMLTALYRDMDVQYPKYFKMDPLSRLGFIAAELLLGHPVSQELDDHTAIILVGHAGCMVTDLKYIETIKGGTDGYYPSPANFVYTLSNIVCGEIAIRHKIAGETSCFLLDRYDPMMVDRLMEQAFCDPDTQRVLGGWIECTSTDNFECKLKLITK